MRTDTRPALANSPIPNMPPVYRLTPCEGQASGLIKVVRAALADVVDGAADVLLAVDRALLGHVAEHLDAEAPVQVADDPLLPRAADDLGRQPPDRARLRHDVVGDRERP